MNKTVVNASIDTHYKENKENLHVSVQIFSPKPNKKV